MIEQTVNRSIAVLASNKPEHEKGGSMNQEPGYD